MNYNKACKLFNELDDLFNEEFGNVKEFDSLSSLFNDYCPEKDGSKKCDTDYDKMSAVGAYLFMDFVEINNIDITSPNDRHIEYFIMWISNKLHEITTNNFESLDQPHENNLDKFIGSFDFLNSRDNTKELKDADITIMNIFYILFKEICETVRIYQTPNRQGHEYTNNITQCYIIYTELSKLVNQCSPYLYLLDHLKTIYDDFRQTVIKEQIHSDILHKVREFPSIDTTTAKCELKSEGCTIVHEKIIKTLPKFIKNEKEKLNDHEKSQQNKNKLITIKNILGSIDNEESGNVKLKDEKLEKTVESKGSPSASQGSAKSENSTKVTQKQDSGSSPRGTTLQSGKTSTPAAAAKLPVTKIKSTKPKPAKPTPPPKAQQQTSTTLSSTEHETSKTPKTNTASGTSETGSTGTKVSTAQTPSTPAQTAAVKPTPAKSSTEQHKSASLKLARSADSSQPQKETNMPPASPTPAHAASSQQVSAHPTNAKLPSVSPEKGDLIQTQQKTLTSPPSNSLHTSQKSGTGHQNGPKNSENEPDPTKNGKKGLISGKGNEGGGVNESRSPGGKSKDGTPKKIDNVNNSTSGSKASNSATSLGNQGNVSGTAQPVVSKPEPPKKLSPTTSGTSTTTSESTPSSTATESSHSQSLPGQPGPVQPILKTLTLTPPGTITTTSTGIATSAHKTKSTGVTASIPTLTSPFTMTTQLAKSEHEKSPSIKPAPPQPEQAHPLKPSPKTLPSTIPGIDTASSTSAKVPIITTTSKYIEATTNISISTPTASSDTTSLSTHITSSDTTSISAPITSSVTTSLSTPIPSPATTPLSTPTEVSPVKSEQTSKTLSFTISGTNTIPSTSGQSLSSQSKPAKSVELSKETLKDLSSETSGTSTEPLASKKVSEGIKTSTHTAVSITTTVSPGEQVETTMPSIETTLPERNDASQKLSRGKRSANPVSLIDTPTTGSGTPENKSPITISPPPPVKPSNTENGSTIGTDVKIDEKSSIWCISPNKKCNIIGIGIIGISIFVFLAFMYK
ncbi:CIR protein, partial [Plasmodium chabaudi chabaudi]